MCSPPRRKRAKKVAATLTRRKGEVFLLRCTFPSCVACIRVRIRIRSADDGEDEGDESDEGEGDEPEVTAKPESGHPKERQLDPTYFQYTVFT